MECNEKKLFLYFEGLLDASDSEAVERHLHECPRCAGMLEDWRRTAEHLGGLERVKPQVDLWPLLERRIRPPRGSRRALWFLGWAAAAAGVLLGVLLGMGQRAQSVAFDGDSSSGAVELLAGADPTLDEIYLDASEALDGSRGGPEQ